jgi:HEAT repeat protein
MNSPSEIGIFTTDEALVVRTWDTWLTASTGIARETAVGRALTDLLPTVESRGLLPRFQEVLTTGSVHVLAPAFHHYLIECPTRAPSTRFAHMQQRVTIGPVREGARITGVIVAIEDVTVRVEAERDLAEALASDDASTRRAAAEAIAAVGRVDEPSTFHPALAADNWRVRQAAIRGLAPAADQSFMASLVSTLREEHRNFNLLSSALKLLSVTDVDVTTPLTELLQDADADLRVQAALALGDQQDAAAVAPLLRALADPDPNVRFQVVESLGRLRAEGAVDALVRIVESEDFFLAFAALDALAAIGDPRLASRLVPLLDTANLAVPVADALGTMGDEHVVPALIASLNTSPIAVVPVAAAVIRIHDRFARQYQDAGRIVDLVRQSIAASGERHLIDAVARAAKDDLTALVRMLGWLDGPAIDQALTRLLSEPAARSEVVEALVRHGDRVVNLLVDQLFVDDRETRHAAIAALGRVGSPRATASLIEMLDGEKDVVVAAAGALARIGDRRAFEPLLALLGHQDASIRKSVVGALNSIGHPDLPARVVRLLNDESARVRESAVRIAGYFGYRETLDRMFELTSDPDNLVRRAALEHLPYLDDDRVLPALQRALSAEAAEVRAAATRAVARVESPAALGALCDALRDADAWVRYFAARGLAEHPHPAAVERLCVCAEHDPATQVRIAATDALGALRSPAAFETLERLAVNSNGEIAATALGALGRLADDRGLPQLQNAARADVPSRRLAAVRALAAQGSPNAAGSLEWAAAADPEIEVSRTAIEGLAAIVAADAKGARAAFDGLITLLSDKATREESIAVVSKLPPAWIPALARGLDHASPDVRTGIVEALGRMRREEATQVITAALQDASPAVREAAVLTLGRIGARGMESTFAGLAARDPSKVVRRAASTALSRLRG